MTTGPLEIREQIARDGSRRVALLGELDLYSAPMLREHLDQLADSAQPVRLDLSRLEFADSTGMAVLVAAVSDATEHRWRIEIETQLSPHVERIVELWGAAAYLWPERGARLSPSA
jgi:anti-sigma B factor antagonist